MPPPRLLLAAGLAQRLENVGEQGLLVGLASEGDVTVLGAVPVAEGDGLAAAADALAPLLPHGITVVGACSSGDAHPSWRPSGAAHAVSCAPCNDSSSSSSSSWRVDGAAAEPVPALAPDAAASGCGGGGELAIAEGFVPLRLHLDVNVDVIFPKSAAVAAAAGGGGGGGANNGGGGSSSAASSSGKAAGGGAEPPLVPPASAIAAAVEKAVCSVAPPAISVCVRPETPPVAPGADPPPPPAPRLLLSGAKGELGAALAGAVPTAAAAASPCASAVPLQCTANVGARWEGLPCAPLFEYEPYKAPTALARVLVGLDVLIYQPASAPAAALPASVAGPALTAQLRAMGAMLQQAAAAGRPLPLAVRAFHFAPPGLGFPVTVAYALPDGAATKAALAAGSGGSSSGSGSGSKKASGKGAAAGGGGGGGGGGSSSAMDQQLAAFEAGEPALLPVRQALHARLGLPDNVPLLRVGNALRWPAFGAPAAVLAHGGRAAQRLRDVHAALPPPQWCRAPGGGGGQGGFALRPTCGLHLVDGHYHYHHYLQDRFNDAGWGCAYRSLQTIVSWFRLQRYTSKPVPGHREIQETLVKIGDKEPSFVGSSKWIGAIELGYVLDEYLGVTCKVLTVNRGDEIPQHARALAAHFDAHGTPVMIGGGVLAYTLLGVAFDEATGEAAFLILDPHYTGGEDLNKITAGTWVGWKQLGDTAAAGGPLFVKDAFYNFLCPQRPRTV